jgi:hypothetical protein
MMVGTLLELLELGGPEAVTEQLNQFPPGQRKEFARTVLASGFPVPETLEEFRTLVAAILHGSPQPHTAARFTLTQRIRPSGHTDTDSRTAQGPLRPPAGGSFRSARHRTRPGQCS